MPNNLKSYRGPRRGRRYFLLEIAFSISVPNFIEGRKAKKIQSVDKKRGKFGKISIGLRANFLETAAPKRPKSSTKRGMSSPPDSVISNMERPQFF
jgi:hypothetical protein